MSFLNQAYRGPLAWLFPRWRDWWVLSLLILVLLLAVQGYAAPRSLYASHRANESSLRPRIYCSDSSPSFGLSMPEFDPAGSYHSRRRSIELSSAGGGIRVEYRAFNGHLDQGSSDPAPEGSDWYFDLDEPIASVDSVITGGGCIIDFQRTGWGLFSGAWDHYPGHHFTDAGTVAAPRCYSAEYWFSAPVWSLAVAPALLMLVRTNHRRRHWARQSDGICRCGYDLRASPLYCPECGAPVVPFA